MHTRIRQRPTELGFQNLLNTSHHEIDNRLRRIDDAVCVGDILGEPLKKLLVKCVEEMLFLGEVSTECRCLFNSDIEPIQGREKRITTHSVPRQRIADVFNLACDNISTCEI